MNMTYLRDFLMLTGAIFSIMFVVECFSQAGNKASNIVGKVTGSSNRRGK